MNLTDPIFSDERKARDYFEAIYWPDGPICPHCGCVNKVYRLEDGGKHRDGLVHCNACDGQFTVRTGTVMESSHLPLTKWALAYRLMASSKKGISALQMARSLDIHYRSAWFLCHRIREAMRDVSGEKIGGPGTIVEADEVWIGGKPRKGQKGRTRADDHKVPVAVLVERRPGGRARATVVSSPLGGVLKRNIAANVAQGSDIHSDDHKAYRRTGEITGGRHEAVKHMIGEYARKTASGESVHNNTAESFNALLERSIVGAFHHVSPEHLPRYCDEVSFRWDRRDMNDAERTVAAIRAGEGKRLTLRKPYGTAPTSA